MFRRMQRGERGQSMVEFALALPILILILSGMLDIGRVYFTFIALEEAAAEAALYLAINPTCPTTADPDSDAGNPCADPNNATFRAQNAGNQELNWTLADVQLFRPTPYGIGDIVRVTIEYPYEFITPGINSITQSVTGGTGLVLTVVANHIIMFEQVQQ
jgi:Flp pilus assembly protein TadG